MLYIIGLFQYFMKNLFNLFLISGLLLGAFLAAPKAYADCQEIYGGNQTCTTTYTWTIQKFVQVPGSNGGNYVNNLSINDPKYVPGQTVNFEISVTNTSSQAIPTINVNDIFPQYVNFATGSGSFNQSSNTLSFTVNNLNAGETRNYYLSGTIVGANSLPVDQGTVCLVNQANGTDNNGAVNTASSQFCVQKSVLGTSFPTTITTTPATGPEMLPLMALIPGGLGGIFLRKKTIKK